MHRFNAAMGKSIEGALKKLLSDKHLYQQVEVDLAFVPNLAQTILESNRKTAQVSLVGPVLLDSQSIISNCNATAILLWNGFLAAGQGAFQILPVAGQLAISALFPLPTINTFCSGCEDSWPFNPVFEGSHCIPGAGQNQWFYLSYQCQQCKGQPIRFLVRREGLKLRLAGRDPIEVLPSPKVLPKTASKFYSDALIAHHAGQTLAGLFLLRVFIEQFWRSLPAVQSVLKQDSRATGEKQGEAYQGTLPEDFKSRFTSLSEVYGSLSKAIHSAHADAELFERACRRIEEHFDARRLFRVA